LLASCHSIMPNVMPMGAPDRRDSVATLRVSAIVPQHQKTL
jgi:hypothetical protein